MHRKHYTCTQPIRRRILLRRSPKAPLVSRRLKATLRPTVLASGYVDSVVNLAGTRRASASKSGDQDLGGLVPFAIGVERK